MQSAVRMVNHRQAIGVASDVPDQASVWATHCRPFERRTPSAAKGDDKLCKPCILIRRLDYLPPCGLLVAEPGPGCGYGECKSCRPTSTLRAGGCFKRTSNGTGAGRASGRMSGRIDRPPSKSGQSQPSPTVEACHSAATCEVVGRVRQSTASSVVMTSANSAIMALRVALCSASLLVALPSATKITW